MVDGNGVAQHANAGTTGALVGTDGIRPANRNGQMIKTVVQNVWISKTGSADIDSRTGGYPG